VIALRFESAALRAPAAEVRAAVWTMRGVNAELMPLLRMSCPAEHRERSLLDAP